MCPAIKSIASSPLYQGFRAGARDASIYYHLLKAEYLFRISKRQGDAHGELGRATESVLARYTWRKLKELVDRSGLKGQPLVPNPAALENRVSELIKEQAADPSSLVGVNPFGFSVDPLDEQLMQGVTGYTVAGPSGLDGRRLDRPC